MKSKVIVGGGHLGFFTLLGLLFIGLKLGGVIDWPWILVLAPLWGPWGVALAIVLGIGLVIGGAGLWVVGRDVWRHGWSGKRNR